jgi:hypothetical protein
MGPNHMLSKRWNQWAVANRNAKYLRYFVFPARHGRYYMMAPKADKRLIFHRGVSKTFLK